MKKKLLILPSWYPTKENPALGSFFKEQAELMSENFDVCVLVGKANFIGRKKYFKGIFNSSINKVEENTVKPNIKEIYFEYNDIVFINSKKRLQKTIVSYSSIVNDLVKKNWIPDVIHAQSVLNAGCIALKIANEKNLPLLTTEHIPIILKNFNSEKQSVFLDTIKKTEQFSVVSNFAKRVILENFADKEVLVLGNLVDDSLFNIPLNKADNESFQIGYVGSLFYRKDPFTFIDSIALVIKENRIKNIKINLIIAGIQGEFTLDDLQKYIKEKQIEEYCNIYTNKNRQEIAILYSQMDLVISTSISETFGLVVAEALMCGVPVIATDNGGVRDIIEPNINGIIVNLKDSNAIAKNILKIYNKEFVFESEKIRESVKIKFGRKAFLKKMTTIYNKIIADYKND